MAKNHLKCSSSLVIIEMKMKTTTLRFYLTPARMVPINKTSYSSCWQECVGRKHSLIHCWWVCKFVQSLLKSVWWFLRKIGIDLPEDPAPPVSEHVLICILSYIIFYYLNNGNTVG